MSPTDASPAVVPGPRGRGQGSPGSASDGLLLTGATGFVGMELLARYLRGTERTVYALVRGRSDEEAAARLAATMRELFPAGHHYGHRVVALRGDMTRPRLGLGRGFDALAEQVTEIVHAAASVSFELGLDELRAINVAGTAEILEFARRCAARGGLRRLSYVSTAYVAGEHRGLFSEDDLDLGQGFRNGYEQSKFEAEGLLAGSGLPITVLRPSIIVGERDSGWTASFNVLYWPLRAFSRGSYLALPGHRGAPVDVVPVDYVADAIFLLSQAPDAEGVTYHLTAGAQASTVGELIELATRYFERPAPRLLEPGAYRRVLHPILKRAVRDERRRRALSRSEIFFPYFAMGVRFDDRRTRVALRASGLAPTPLAQYFDRLLDYAVAADWGRRSLPRSTTATRAGTRPRPRRRRPAGAARSRPASPARALR